MSQECKVVYEIRNAGKGLGGFSSPYILLSDGLTVQHPQFSQRGRHPRGQPRKRSIIPVFVKARSMLEEGLDELGIFQLAATLQMTGFWLGE